MLPVDADKLTKYRPKTRYNCSESDVKLSECGDRYPSVLIFSLPFEFSSFFLPIDSGVLA
jgi:hypothetical protein